MFTKCCPTVSPRGSAQVVSCLESSPCVTSNWAGIKLSGSHVTCVLCSLHETLGTTHSVAELSSQGADVNTGAPSSEQNLPAHVYNAESMALTIVKMVSGDNVVMSTQP